MVANFKKGVFEPFWTNLDSKFPKSGHKALRKIYLFILFYFIRDIKSQNYAGFKTTEKVVKSHSKR